MKLFNLKIIFTSIYEKKFNFRRKLILLKGELAQRELPGINKTILLFKRKQIYTKGFVFQKELLNKILSAWLANY